MARSSNFSTEPGVFTNTMGYYQQLTLLMSINIKCRMMRDVHAWYDSLSSLSNLTSPFLNEGCRQAVENRLKAVQGLLLTDEIVFRANTREGSSQKVMAENRAFVQLNQCEKELYEGMKKLLLQMQKERQPGELFEHLGVSS